MNHRSKGHDGLPSRLEPAEMADLTRQFRLRFDRAPTAVQAVRCADLLESGACAAYLDRLTEVLQSPSRMITASMFSKRYVFLSAVPVLYALSAYDKGLQFSLENTALEQPAYESGGWSPGLRVAKWRVTEPAADSREEWRSEIIASLFAKSLAPLWRVLAEVTDIPLAILWENTAVRLFSLYEKRLAQLGCAQTRERAERDFLYVVADASGTCFGEAENPLLRFYRPQSAHPASGKPVRIRQTCCFYYRVSADGSFCANCPKAAPAARERWI
ncbi:IucA/IucC family C-terminal-domain containing protein [Brevibacillus marinus]|uniref:IucA/IucC family C-terminal-domain containing protein n=1 Tax=Brevibacillus marinus TaxID=2496837 RepID=UPI0013DEC422|nr:IucA/IucC family C-terminal-domain containing protein [Brevibacillus marinus]